MTDSLCSLDYGEDLVIRFRASGLTRREFAERAGISVSTLDYYVRRERKASLPGALPVNRILPVDRIRTTNPMPALARGVLRRFEFSSGWG